MTFSLIFRAIYLIRFKEIRAIDTKRVCSLVYKILYLVYFENVFAHVKNNIVRSHVRETDSSLIRQSPLLQSKCKWIEFRKRRQLHHGPLKVHALPPYRNACTHLHRDRAATATRSPLARSSPSRGKTDVSFADAIIASE